MTSSVSRKPLLARIFQRLPKSSTAQMPYRVQCPCGQGITGVRKRRALELNCPKCGGKVFVLSRSAWPPPQGSTTPANAEETPPPIPSVEPDRPRRRIWLLPLGVGILAISTAVWSIWVYGPQVMRSARQDMGRTFAECQSAYLAAIEKGDFGLAATYMEEGVKALHREPALHRQQQATLYRLLDQVRTLAELSPLALEEVIGWAEEQERKPPGERVALNHFLPQRVFVFDSSLHAPPPQAGNAARDLRLEYQVLGKTLPVVLDFSNQETLINVVPLEKPLRWIIALRLDSIILQADELHPKGRWVLRFEPNKVCLLTDPRLFRVWRLHGDQLPLEVLQRQQELLIAHPDFDQLPLKEIRNGATRTEVEDKIGPPMSVARLLWKDQYNEQWSYSHPPQLITVSFHSKNGGSPRVVQVFKDPL